MVAANFTWSELVPYTVATLWIVLAVYATF